MIDPNYEIDMLKQRLRFKNLSEPVIDSICADASHDIISISTDLLADAMEEAVRAGAEAKSVQFINELRVVQNGNQFAVGTESGRRDFSEPPFPMLPKLLKNAKTAQDGSLYKVIPLRDKSAKRSSGRMAVTTEAALKNINESRQAAKDLRDELGDDYTTSLTPDALKGMSTFAALQAINDVRKAFPTMKQKSTEPVMAFRTASSKQSPSEKWVHPGREVMMGNVLHEINARLQDRLDQAIMDVIRRHEDIY